MSHSEFELLLNGYGLITAEILYHMPDHQSFLQCFIWQEYDQAPEFPRLYQFLDFWEEKLDGPLHSVRYTHQKLIQPGEWHKVDGEILLH